MTETIQTAHRVLIVEDEPLIRWSAIEMIEDAGYEIFEAANADEALRILEACHDIEFVFTDVDMPGSMDGLNFARAVHDRWPPIKILVTSGKKTPSNGQLPQGGRFLAKPYLATDVVGALARLAA